jgi:hypothetical protein
MASDYLHATCHTRERLKNPPHFTESRKKPIPNHTIFVNPQTINQEPQTFKHLIVRFVAGICYL